MRRLIRQTTRAGVPPLLLRALRCDRMPLQMSSLRKQGRILRAPSIGCGVWVPALRPGRRCRGGSNMLRTAAALFLALAWPMSADAQTFECHAGQKPREVAQLLFGRKIGDRLGV